MNKILHKLFLIGSIGIGLTACNRTYIDTPITEGKDGERITVSLSVANASGKTITIDSRATNEEEQRLDNLYIYIFNENGNLKGFKKIEDASQLNQQTSDKGPASIQVKTTIGRAYIYAVANINTGLYPVDTTEQLPIDFNEEEVQDGKHKEDFTLKDLLNLPFVRNNRGSIQIASRFLMSGAVNNGGEVIVNKDGTLTGDNIIRLRRIVAKVRFNIGTESASGISRTFKAESYDWVNLSMRGSLISRKDAGTGNDIYTVDPDNNNYSNITGNIFTPNDVENGKQFFTAYIPENLQEARQTITAWHEREDDTQTNPKTFTNAPLYGTYIVIHGTYTEENNLNNTSRNATVTYYVHLGDCTTDVNDYNVERNASYTYNITVKGVDKIVVEARQEGNEQPGSEGVVMEYGKAGKMLTLDSHYEYMVMRFFQDDIQTLKREGRGYVYQVQTFGKRTDVISVTDTEEGNSNSVDTDWIEFAMGNSEYDDENSGRGTPCDYPGKNTDGSMKTGLYSIQDFLKLLYKQADASTFWTKSVYDSEKKKYRPYIDATCFVKENYYENMLWSQYVNDVPKRAFYVANEVKESIDSRSVYATVAYGLEQYPIQTFYDRTKASYVTAYGCETTNDEDGKGFKSEGELNYKDKWDGRANMLSGIAQEMKASNGWSTVKSNKALYKACLSRNRDLNGDGKITADEVRWYAPTINQYGGFWIGENILSAESRLYNKSTSLLGTSPSVETGHRKLYFASSNNDQCTFFAEEGMATGNKTASTGSTWSATLVRCVRNLKSHHAGYDSTPNAYYTTGEVSGSSAYYISLDKVDAQALNTTGEQGELNDHNERDESNKPAQAFHIAQSKTSGGTNISNVVTGRYTCKDNYSQDGKVWRVPNQREYILMSIVNGNSFLSDTFTRTIFSNSKFRYSWAIDGNNLMMPQPGQSKWGYVRCISVDK